MKTKCKNKLEVWLLNKNSIIGEKIAENEIIKLG